MQLIEDPAVRSFGSPSNPDASTTTNVKSAPDLEPVAIVGIACRLPGDATDPSKLWSLLVNGESAWSAGPDKRYNLKGFRQKKNQHATTTNTNGGHFLSEDIAAFDAPFFAINPNEASAMDPQQRLMLEVAYEAFENAGISTQALSNSDTGVYVGQWTCDYAEMLARDVEYPAFYHTTGVGPAITSNRVSYQFNLKGPSFTVDTGCSASLVALHMAVQSLRSGETSASFVGGVNLLVDPQRFLYQSKLKMFSNDGRSFSFDHRANGYGRGEGCTGVVLKTLSSALRDGDTIRAVIRQSVLNQDGKTPGISVPSGEAQELAIRKAYSDAGLELRADYVEAHGTGTAVGDPIETEAIAAAFSKYREASYRLPVGSIKGNIGHTESAAGLAGLVKAILMLENDFIPPQVNFEKVNEKIPLEEWRLRIPIELERKEMRRISINSFGYGGTNAHVILDSARDYEQSTNTLSSVATSPDRARLFIISAANERSLKLFAERLVQYVSKSSTSMPQPQFLDSLAYTLNRRTVHKCRMLITAADCGSLLGQLQALARKPAPAAPVDKKHRFGYVYGGQGAQYFNMGRELITTWPHFTASLERANKHLQSIGSGFDLVAELQKDAAVSLVDSPRMGQPLSTAIQLALTDQLFALNIRPSAVVGHSSGEIAAAYAAGILDFEDAMTIAYHRGRLVDKLLSTVPVSEHGEPESGMLAVGTSASIVEGLIEQLEHKGNGIEIVCYNSPASITVAGNSLMLKELVKLLESQKIFNRLLRTKGAAYHSLQMQAIEEDYGVSLEKISFHKVDTDIVMFSSLRGGKVSATELDYTYWVDNLTSPVLFEDALAEMARAMTSAGDRVIDAIVEVGPHSQMEGAVKQILQAQRGPPKELTYATVLKRKSNAAESFLGLLGRLYTGGAEPRLHYCNNGFSEDLPRPLTDVPSYAFDHDRTYWHESRLSREFRFRDNLPHELLGSRVLDSTDIEPRWRRYLDLKSLPWLEGHRIQGQIVFPASAYLAMAIEAARRHCLSSKPGTIISSFDFRNVVFGRAMLLNKDSTDHEISLSLKPETRSSIESSADWLEFRVFAVSDGQDWVEHCRGLISVIKDTSTVSESAKTFDVGIDIDTSVDAKHASQEVSPEKFYYLSRDIGLDWRKGFDSLTGIRLGTGSSHCTIDLEHYATRQLFEADSEYLMHPAVLDGALFHGLCAVMLFKDAIDTPSVPTSIAHLRLWTSPAKSTRLLCSAQKNDIGTFDVAVRTDNDDVIVSGSNISTTPLPSTASLQLANRQLTHRVGWQPDCGNLTAESFNSICKTNLPQESVELQNRAINGTALAHIERAYRAISEDEVPQDHRLHWYNWMKTVVDLPDDSEAISTAANSSLDLGAAGEAASRIGANIAGIMRGEVDPLVLLNNDDILTRIYSDRSCVRCYSQISAFLSQYVRQNPNLKMLEIGAGTAAASEPILGSLLENDPSAVSTYDFTDISPAFLSKAQEKLARFGGAVKYKVFDCMQDPALQGFQKGGYDVVIACNVIHAVPSLATAVDNVRALLRPGGFFILLEITREEIFYNLVFGSLPGWWLGTTEGRTSSPLLTTEKWIETIQDHGFDKPPAVLADYQEKSGGTMSVFISRAVLPETARPSIDIVSDLSDNHIPGLSGALKTILPCTTINELDLTSYKNGSRSLVILTPEVCEAMSCNVDEVTFAAFKDSLTHSGTILLLTRGGCDSVIRPQSGLVAGLTRNLRCEDRELRIITLDVVVDATAQESAEAISRLLADPSFDLGQEILTSENEYALRKGQLQVSRLINDETLDGYVRSCIGTSEPVVGSFFKDGRYLKAELAVPGLLETLRWAEIKDLQPLSDDEIELDLRAASINFKDVLIAAGQLPGLTEMSNDCSGVVTKVGANMRHRFKPGDRVCCYYSRSYTNKPRVHGDCCAVIPDSMSFATGASLPIVWGTVYHALVDRGQLKRGESILIHSAAGAVGQAGIILAKYLGAEIFATVGTADKKKFLVETYGLKAEHIFSSRTTAFGKRIRALTPKRGVDVVLNSLAGEIFRETCNTVAPYGRFIEIGRKQFMEDMLMPTRFLLRNITFSYIDLALMIKEIKPTVRCILENVILLMDEGHVFPTAVKSMPIDEIESAFRQIQTGKHMGKLVLTADSESTTKIVPCQPKYTELDPTASYVVVGGLGGLGKTIVKWLASRGARRILCLSRSAAVTPSTLDFIGEMRLQDCSVLPLRCDVSKLEDVKNVFASVSLTSPVRGVIQSAMVIQDALLANMTHEQWNKAVQPKIAGSWNIHLSLPNTTNFFILMSSAVALGGNPGQTNYGAACSYQDALARFRAQQGLPAYSINVGAVSDIGFVSENPEVATALRRQGLGTITSHELLAHLDFAISHPIAPSPEAAQSSIGLMPAGTERGLGESTWLREARFRQIASACVAVATASAESADQIGAIRTAGSFDESLAAISVAIIQQLSKLIAMPVEHISEQGRLDDYGVDSLVAVELRNWIGTYLQADITIMALRDTASINELCHLVADKSSMVTHKPLAT